jgi:hypothetical protein
MVVPDVSEPAIASTTAGGRFDPFQSWCNQHRPTTPNPLSIRIVSEPLEAVPEAPWMWPNDRRQVTLSWTQRLRTQSKPEGHDHQEWGERQEHPQGADEPSPPRGG